MIRKLWQRFVGLFRKPAKLDLVAINCRNQAAQLRLKPLIDGHMLMCLENHGYDAQLRPAKQCSANDPVFRWPRRRPMVAALPMASYAVMAQEEQIQNWLAVNALTFCSSADQAMGEIFGIEFASGYEPVVG